MHRSGRWLLPALALALALFGVVRHDTSLRFAARSPDDQRVIYISSNGWHTGIVIPVSGIPPDRLPAKAYFPSASFLEIGWGEAGFYRAKDITLGLYLTALFASESSVMHLVGFSQPVTQFFPYNDTVEIRLSSQGLDRLLTFIESSFRKGASGQPVFLGPGLYRDSFFFESGTRYSALRTCNTWVAQALWEAGLPMSPLFAVRSATLLNQAMPFGKPMAKRDPPSPFVAQ